MCAKTALIFVKLENASMYNEGDTIFAFRCMLLVCRRMESE